ncbi:MAG: signal peptidase I, partial [Candidatus Omnitrophica bacterium]|nr:signal peptidase I [Candidatus Omnitrophota bacterium]
LSCLVIGLGQMYAGRVARVMAIIVLPLMLTTALAIYIVVPHTKIDVWMPAGFVSLYFVFVIWALMDAYRCANWYNQDHQVERQLTKGKKAGLIGAILLALCLPDPTQALGPYIKKNFLQAFKMPAGSMRTALIEGDRLFADKRRPLLNRVQRGDVIVFKYPVNPERDFVKRVIAFGGETVEIIEGDVFVNGQRVADPRIKDIFYFNSAPYGEEGTAITVPAHYLYVLGDNSGSSHDSRFWGFVPEENVTGIAYKIYWPPERSGPIH